MQPVQEVDLSTRVRDVVAGAPHTLANPHAVWRQALEHGPVFQTGREVYAVGYRQAKEVVSDQDRFSNLVSAGGARIAALLATLDPAQRQAFDELIEFEGHYIQRNGGEEHRRLRNQAKRAFTPRHVADMRGAVQAATDRLLEGPASDGVADLRAIAYQLPLFVISDMLGVPKLDGPLIHAWSNRLAAGLTRRDGTVIVDANEAIKGFSDYIDHLILDTEAGRLPGGPLLTELMASEQAGHITRVELNATIINTLFAGHETTANLVSVGMFELLSHREQWELLCQDVSTLPNAVEELLRVTTPVGFLPRTAPRDLEWEGLSISAGDSVMSVMVAGNRDPDVFAEPDVLDITRFNAKDHLAFGFGKKFCLGAGLGRLEAEVMFGTLARRFPELELIEPAAALEWEGPSFLRRLATLPVRLGPDHDPPGGPDA
jgi:cytochrome P450